MSKLAGSCLCGGVTYSSSDDEPVMVAICHCNDCQKQSGAAFSTNVAVTRAGFTINGDSVASYETVGEETNEPRRRVFCSNCGSPIVSELAEMPDLTFIKAGTLDDRSWLEPELEVFTSRKQGWVTPNEELGLFPTGLQT